VQLFLIQAKFSFQNISKLQVLKNYKSMFFIVRFATYLAVVCKSEKYACEGIAADVAVVVTILSA